MKKLVTIVSAVMMLLMLAACTNELSVTADERTYIEAANAVGDAMVTAALKETPESNVYSLTVSDEKKVYISWDDETRNASNGSTAVITKNTDSVDVSVEATMKYDIISADMAELYGTDAKAFSVTVSFEGTLNKDGSYTVNEYVVNGTPYEKYFGADILGNSNLAALFN